MNCYVSGNFYSLTDKGLVRQTNEDATVSAINAFGDILLAVADGMGGRNKGDYASQTICKFLSDKFKLLEKKFTSEKQVEKWLYKNINAVNRTLYEKSKSNPEFSGMGSTLSLVLLTKNILMTAQVGDSRIYSIDGNNKLVQLSVDQSYVQYLEHANKINESEAKSHPERHKITNAIGIRYDCNVDFKFYKYTGQRILLCSDGVYNNVSNNEISSILKSNDTPERKCKQLINFGNANGGSDNMAVIIWEASNWCLYL